MQPFLSCITLLSAASEPSLSKASLLSLLLQIVMGTAVSFFFSGFVMGKIPFGLSPRFRPMLQVRPASVLGKGAEACQGFDLLIVSSDELR
jgi:hypothetical protein